MGMYDPIIILIVILVPSLCDVPDVVVNPIDGRGYKLMYEAQTWSAARDKCMEMGAKLAVPKSNEQFTFIQKIVRSMHYPSIVGGSSYKLLAWVGISNTENYRMWKNVDGENIEDTGYHTWAGQYNGYKSDDLREPHCVGMDAVNTGLRNWWCDHRQPYICEVATQEASSS